MINYYNLHLLILIYFLSYITLKSCKLKKQMLFQKKKRHIFIRLKIFFLTFLFFKSVYYFISNDPTALYDPSSETFATKITFATFLTLFSSHLIYCLAKIIAIKYVGWNVADIRILPISLRFKYPDRNSNKKVIRFEHSDDFIGNVAAVSYYP